MKLFKFNIVSPNDCLFEGEASAVSVTGVLGKLTVLSEHAPFLTALVPCECVISGNEDRNFQINGGALKVKKGEVSIYLY